MTATGWLVVGLGNPDRGDDGVGPAVVARLARLGLPAVDIVARAEPTDLLDVLEGRRRVVVVDAVRAARPPGTVLVLETGAGLPPLPAAAWDAEGRAGTHGLGLSEVLELARALERMPRRVVVLGVEAGAAGQGRGLSPDVAAAVDVAVTAIGVLVGAVEPSGEA